jgi:hypothetical protein
MIFQQCCLAVRFVADTGASVVCMTASAYFVVHAPDVCTNLYACYVCLFLRASQVHAGVCMALGAWPSVHMAPSQGRGRGALVWCIVCGCPALHMHPGWLTALLVPPHLEKTPVQLVLGLRALVCGSPAPMGWVVTPHDRLRWRLW